MTKNERALQINSANALKGFWNQPINYSEKLVLACGELHEAVEAHRNGKHAGDQITINMQTPDSEFKALYEREVKGTIDEELADAAIRRIAEHLLKYREINPIQAKTLYGCMRLAARILDLRKGGVKIMTDKKSFKNAAGNNVSFAVYRLAI